MPWKRRGNHEYFYESRRDGGRVVSMYRGGGPAGELASVLAAVDQARREAERAKLSRRRAAERERARELDGIASATLGAVEQYINLLGYHRHDRGPWRKRRGIMSATTTPARIEAARQQLTVLDRSMDLMVVRQMARRFCGAEGKSAASNRRRFRREVAEMAEDLAGGPGAPPAVQALATLAAISWGEWAAVSTLAQLDAEDRRADGRIALNDRLVDRAQRRYVRALKALADVRRVEPPTLVQINNNTQYNLAGPPPG